MASLRTLDRTDHRLVALLQNNARLSNKELAAAAGIAPSTCSERVRRLEADGIFRGFHADVVPAALGIGVQAMVSVRLRRQNADEVEAFHTRIEALDEVAAVFHVTGGNDFLVHICVRDTDHLREVVVGEFSKFPEIAHLESSLIFDRSGDGTLPDLA